MIDHQRMINTSRRALSCRKLGIAADDRMPGGHQPARRSATTYLNQKQGAISYIRHLRDNLFVAKWPIKVVERPMDGTKRIWPQINADDADQKCANQCLPSPSDLRYQRLSAAGFCYLSQTRAALVFALRLRCLLRCLQRSSFHPAPARRPCAATFRSVLHE